MLTTKEKQLADLLSREILIYSVENSRHKDNKDVKRWIKEEASYEDVVCAAWNKQVLLEQDDTTVAQAVRLNALNAAESKFKMFMNIPLSILAGGAVSAGYAAKTAGTVMGSGALGFLGSGMATMLASTGVGIGVGILAKVIFILIQKHFDKCAVECRKRFTNKNDPFHRYEIQICISQCRIAATNAMIAKIQSERGKCSGTKNPEKCEAALLSQAGKFRTIMQKEMQRLQKRQLALRKVQEKYGKNKALTAEPPALANAPVGT